MRRRSVRLSEEHLHRVLNESVRRVLREGHGGLSFPTVKRYLEHVGFECVADYDMRHYLSRNDDPIPFEKKIWDENGQIIVSAEVYTMGNGSKDVYSVYVTFGHGDYDINDVEGESGDLTDIHSLRRYMKENNLERWD